MKRFFIFLMLHASFSAVFAQSPQKMSYQAVIRNGSGQLIVNQSIGMRISILQGTETGLVVYSETHNPTTNANGLVTFEIGGGSVISGTFANIDWASGPYFIKTETDPLGGSNYTISGTSQMLSVPYALYAATSENGFSGEYGDLKNIPLNLDDDKNNDVLLTGDQTISGNKTFSGTINASNKQVKGVANPIEATDAANKAYVDLLAQKVTELEAIVDKYGSVKDFEGNTYRTIKIGQQVWMAENLKSKVDRYGNQSVSYISPNMDTNTVSEYGMLYNCWVTTDDVCPTGWRLPTDDDWKTLERYIGFEESQLDSFGCSRGNNEAVKLKLYGITGLNVIFPGVVYSAGGSMPTFRDLGIKAVFWCYGTIPVPGKYPTGIVNRAITIYNDNICREPLTVDSRYSYYGSIRCLKE